MRYFILILLLASCGSDDKKTVEQKPEFIRDISPMPPVFFESFPADKKCASNFKGTFYTKLVDGPSGRIVWNKKEISNSKKLFSSMYINSVMGFMGDGIDVIGSKVKVCPEHLYPERSLEQISINTAASLNDVANSLESYRVNTNRIPKVSIFIQPSKKIYVGSRDEGDETIHYYYLLANNATFNNYESSMYEGPGINIYPASEEFLEFNDQVDSTKMFGGVPFWYFPFVVAHEYGHHYLSNYLWGSKEEKFNFTKLNTPSFVEFPFNKKTNEKRMYGFLHELYADYFAHYVIIGKNRKFKNVRCLEMNRELESFEYYSDFGDVFKILSSSRLSTFSYDEEGDYVQPCNLVFTDKYKVAAIFNYLFVKNNKTLNLSDQKSFKLMESVFRKIIANQFKIIDHYKNNDTDLFLISFMNIYFDSTVFKSEKLEIAKKEKICSDLEKILPALSNEIIYSDDFNRNLCN